MVVESNRTDAVNEKLKSNVESEEEGERTMRIVGRDVGIREMKDERRERVVTDKSGRDKFVRRDGARLSCSGNRSLSQDCGFHSWTEWYSMFLSKTLHFTSRPFSCKQDIIRPAGVPPRLLSCLGCCPSVYKNPVMFGSELILLLIYILLTRLLHSI